MHDGNTLRKVAANPLNYLLTILSVLEEFQSTILF